MKLAIGSDHGGFRMKTDLIEYLKELDIETIDLGTHSDASVDYPDIAEAVAREVLSGRVDRGILVCGTGIGIGIAANKIQGIRAALCHDTFSAQMSREHNDANILTLGERVVGFGLAREIVRVWTEASFSGGRHERRIEKIAALERGEA